MRINRTAVAVTAAALLIGVTSAVIAQPPVHKMTSTHTMAPKRGFNLFGRGKFIGNKNTHVYHLPGDKGNLPAEKNRVYFRSEAEARRAGFHLAGKHGPILPLHPRGHSMPMHGKM